MAQAGDAIRAEEKSRGQKSFPFKQTDPGATDAFQAKQCRPEPSSGDSTASTEVLVSKSGGPEGPLLPSGPVG